MAENVKPTPGPWAAEKAETWQKRIRVNAHDGLDEVAGVYSDDIDFDEAKANARLIAAAPELLEALQAADRILWMAEKYAEGGGSGGPEQRDYDEAAPLIKAALAKAEGKP